MHRLYCWSDRPILCGNVTESDGKKCLYSRYFRFYKQFDVSSIISQCRQDSEVQNEMIFRDREASFGNSVAETPGAF